MTQLDTQLQRAWSEHAAEPLVIAQRLVPLVDQARSPEELLQLGQLAVHVLGEHLGHWQEGLSFLDTLAQHPSSARSGPLLAAWQRQRAGLLLAAGDPAASAATAAAIAADDSVPAASHEVRIHALAAGLVVAHQGLARARQLMSLAVSAASYGPGASDPAARALAISSHNLAAELAERPQRDAAATALMLELAHTSRSWWAVAGGALEAERAEYRLAMCYLAANDGRTALGHAQRCLSLASAEGMLPSERVYANLAIARCQLALGELLPARAARNAASELIPILIPAVKAQCLQELAGLDAQLAAAPPG